MRLVADIGGTKALLGLIDESAAELRFIAKERLLCERYAGFAPMLTDFLQWMGIPGRRISGGCLAVAGPVDASGRRVVMTNLPWTIDADALSAEFGIGPLVIVNDFVAAALGTTTLSADALDIVQVGEPEAHGVRLVIGAGTGLGMAVLVDEGDGWRVLPGEGGHAAFAPANDMQLALWQALRREHHGRVSWEHVVSGRGLIAIYRFLAGDAVEAGLLGAVDPAAAIAAEAASKPHGAARRAFDLFLHAYGAFAGDMALALSARGGVYLTGSIAAANAALFRAGAFLHGFNAKARQAALTRRMPICIATDASLGVNGAACYDRARDAGTAAALTSGRSCSTKEKSWQMSEETMIKETGDGQQHEKIRR